MAHKAKLSIKIRFQPVVTGGAGGAQIFANQLTLSQPGGGRLGPSNNTVTPRIFSPSYGPKA